MRKRFGIALIGLVLAAIAVAGCGGGDDDDGGGEGSSTAATRWEGTFESTFGELRFSADGDRVTGSYDYCGGELEGTADGSRLTGEWEEDPGACESGEQRGSTTETKGTFDFTLAPDDSAFTGNWRYASGAADPQGDEWAGRRISGSSADSGAGSG
jgi:hypothetical protein